MHQVIAYGTAFVTIGLVLSLPRTRVGPSLGPAAAGAFGVIVLLAVGVVSPGDLGGGLAVLWRPFVTVLALMVTTSVAERLGVLDYFTTLIRPSPGQAVARTFRNVFMLGVATSAVLNNDAAVLLLTPLVVDLVCRSYPDRPDLAVPFAFAVFAAAGVAPLVTANPMNLVVADVAGIGFNAYAARMIPIAVAGWLAAYLMLRLIFRRQLRSAAAGAARRETGSLSPAGKQFLVLMLVALGSYPVLSYAGSPVWVVAAATAALGIALCHHHRAASPRALVAAVSWETLVFLFCVFVIAIGLRNVGLVDRVADLYAAPAGAAAKAILIGVSSAVGSAVLNNHPMSIINALAIATLPEPRQDLILAALIGGDLGPRLLPMGSLAALLWLASLRRQGVHIGTATFVRVGVVVTLPALAVSLLLLIALG